MLEALKLAVVKLPLVRQAAAALGIGPHTFRSSEHYWEQRYAHGGTSGRGSYGPLAEWKAKFISEFLMQEGVTSAIEFGCGDGNQLSLVPYRTYVGLDVSRVAIRTCVKRFSDDSAKSFFLYHPEGFADNLGVFRAELALSLDVVYHLVEQATFEAYMRHLFGAARRYVIIYSSDTDAPSPDRHIRHRQFTAWVAQHLGEWRLRIRVVNQYPLGEGPEEGSFADFYVFERAANAGAPA